jgi:hypothetical protein
MDLEGFYIFVGDNQTHLVQASYPFSFILHIVVLEFSIAKGGTFWGRYKCQPRLHNFFVCIHYIVIGHCMQGTSCLCKHQCVQTLHLHTHEGYGLWMEMKYFSTGL